MTDLDDIRALLIAQTADPEPKTKGLFGRLFASKPLSERPARCAAILNLDAPAEADGGEQELLLEHTFRPRHDESQSPLRPPEPRATFGRRPDLFPEPELVLDRPAAVARRLQLLDLDGQPVGEMILRPDEAPGMAPTMIPSAVVVGGEVPYFPEDLDDHHAAHGPEPLRPWLKALRNSKHQPLAAPGETPAVTAFETPPAPKPRRRPRKASKPKAEVVAPAPTAPEGRTLSEDLMEALALTLSREHEILSDRLFALGQAAIFVTEAEQAAA